MADPTRTNTFTSDFKGEPTPMPQLLERGLVLRLAQRQLEWEVWPVWL